VPVNAAPHDESFASTAIKLGLVQETQVSECVKIQTAMRDMGVSEQISRILVKKGFLDEPKVQQILKALGVERDLIPGFQIQAKLGQGGMATVYKARQVSVDRVVALKVLADFAAKDTLYIRRFLQEARTAAKMNHRNIVAVFDAGAYATRYFLVMEYVQGQTIRELLFSKGPMAPRQAAEILLQITDALNYLHGNNLLHRDIKPENVLLTKEGVAKLADFGLAKSVQLMKNDQSLTRSGCIMGTPFYMSPEQIRGHRGMDIRSDLYSLGCTLYFMLTREPPFVGKTPVVTMQMHLKEPAPDPRERNAVVPAELAQITLKLMEKDPELRYKSPAALREDLNSFLRGKPAALARQHAAAAEAVKKAKRRRVTARRTGSSVALFVGLAALVAGAGFLLYSQAAGSADPAAEEELALRKQAADANALITGAEEDMRSGRWRAGRSKLEQLLSRHGSLSGVADRREAVAASLSRCRDEVRRSEEAVRALLTEARRFEETGAWTDASAKYELAVARSIEGDASELKSSLARCNREREAEQIFASIQESLQERKWATSLSLARFLKDQFPETRTLAKNAKSILEAESVAAGEQGAEQVLARARAAAESLQWPALNDALREMTTSFGRTLTARENERELLGLREAWNQANQSQANQAAESLLAEGDALFARKQWLEAKVVYHRFIREFGATPAGSSRRTYAHERVQRCHEALLGDRETEAGQLLAQLRDRFRSGLWEEALRTSDALLEKFEDTKLVAAHKGEISRARADAEGRTAHRVYFEETFEGPFRAWQPESQKRPYPAAQPAEEGREGRVSCRLTFTGAGGSFHRLVYPLDRIDAGARQVTFWARAASAPSDRAPLVLIVLREASSEGTEQFVKEITLTHEWQFVTLDLSAFRRTWGTKSTDARLQIERVTGLGFEPLPTEQSLDILLDQIRFLAPKQP